jgi:hypothetical protein
VRTSVDPIPNYVWPDLRWEDGSDALVTSPVVLVTAPGAMGKSAAAMSVARRTNGVYVDLAKMNVGSGTLTGEIAKALGFGGAEEFFGDLRSGSTTLVLDSTDEAQLRAGTENFIAFIRDLAWQLSTAEGSAQVMMFGRSDSIDLTLLALEELGIMPPVLEIAPLSYESSSEFLDLQLDRRFDERGAARFHRTHTEPFGRLRDRVFHDITCALQGEDIGEQFSSSRWELTQEFLGYPPVLAAIAERLHVDNPIEELGKLQQGSRTVERKKRGELLRQIVEQILDRESVKARTATGERLGIRETDPLRATLYTRDEQVARMLALSGVAGIMISHPATLDESDRVVYDGLVETFIQDHPFLRRDRFSSEVFSDYVRAWAISSPQRGGWVTNEADFNRSLPPVGPFFAQFLAALSPSETPSLPEWQLKDVVESHKLGARASRAVYIQHAEYATLLLADDDDREYLTFEVVELSGVVQLASPLSRVTVISDMGIKLLSGPAGQVDIGPDVVVIADYLEIKGTHLLVTARDSPSGFSMLSAKAVDQEADLKVTSYPQNSLIVDFPDAWYQWTPYALDKSHFVQDLGREVTAQILIAVRRILTSFRPSTGESPTVSAEKVDRLLVGRNSVYAATRDAMLQLDVLARQGPTYELNLDRLAAFHVSWTDLRGDDPAKALRDLCNAVIEVGEFSKPSST